MTLYNAGAYPITIAAEAVAATAADRIVTSDGDITLYPGKIAEIVYLSAISRWLGRRDVNIATVAELRAGTAKKLVSMEVREASLVFVPLAFGATVTVDLSLGLNFELGETNAITSAFTLVFSNVREGVNGMVRIKQGATPRLVTWGTGLQFPGSKPALTATKDKYDDLFFTVRSATGPVISCSLAKNVAAWA